ncbi:MAG: pyridoxal-phosphate dependent enzyme [Myxococcales bacterium]|nr:pyridoxal-phosphate dependent enzyme [Myxococcales bacterium]
MSERPLEFVCHACQSRVAARDEPFACPRRGEDDADHVLEKRFPATFDGGFERVVDPTRNNPFLRYRRLLTSYAIVDDDARFVELVTRLDDAVASVDGGGFRVSPLATETALGNALGRRAALWVKDETHNVAGSHKARHLMGILLYLEALGVAREHPLAIASCGNAALAAAVVARAARRPLSVYLPPSASPTVLDRLRALDARIEICPRFPGTSGDPCYHGFQRALREGAIPFCCTGPDNALTIEGGETLGFELAEGMRTRGVPHHLLIQVGGGALASAVTQALFRAHRWGWIEQPPKIDPVQTRGAWPLPRAFERVVELLAASGDDRGSASDALEAIVRRRSSWMWAWEDEPQSIAHGILDDETYDGWQTILGTLRSGGRPLIVEESDLHSAYQLAQLNTTIRASHTGVAGLAGLLALEREQALRRDETVCLLFTGIER